MFGNTIDLIFAFLGELGALGGEMGLSLGRRVK
jgi:hypothetical protein